MNELGSQLDGKLLAQILQCVDSAANPVPRLKDDDGETFLGKLRGCGQSRRTGADYDHVKRSCAANLPF